MKTLTLNQEHLFKALEDVTAKDNRICETLGRKDAQPQEMLQDMSRMAKELQEMENVQMSKHSLIRRLQGRIRDLKKPPIDLKRMVRDKLKMDVDGNETTLFRFMFFLAGDQRLSLGLIRGLKTLAEDQGLLLGNEGLGS